MTTSNNVTKISKLPSDKRSNMLFRASYKHEVNIAHSVELILEGFSIFIFNFYSKDKKLNI